MLPGAMGARSRASPRAVIKSAVAFSFQLTLQRQFWACVSACLLSTACEPPPSQDDGSDEETTSTNDETTSESGDGGPVLVCEPGETQCADAGTLETCHPTGLKWDASPCEDFEECDSCVDDGSGGCVAACVGPCDRLADQPSSEGCSFFTTGMYQALQPEGIDLSDAIVVGNPSPDLIAHVDLYFVPEGSNIEELEASFDLMPLEYDVFPLSMDLTDYNLETSLFRSGKVHHVVSNVPVVAYLHSPYLASSTNGSSMLLPEQVMAQNYVVYGHMSYTTPSYFVVIALHNQTTVTWRPTRDTAGDALPLPFVDADAGEVGEQLLNRFDNMRILTSKLDMPPICTSDLSGTVIEADKPIWVLSATRAARIPFCEGDSDMPVEGCPPMVNEDCHAGGDLIQEQNIPLEYWGREYIGPHSPLRATEQHYWRIYAGEDDVNIDVQPLDMQLHFDNRGDWQDLLVPNGTNLYFTSTNAKVFMPVQYLSGDYDAGGIGSPAMVQMVPTAQFLDNYVFVTGTGYESNFVQVMREAGSADVTYDGGQIVSGWAPIQGWEVATVSISEGAHQIESEDNFGIIVYGWNSKPTVMTTAAYAYPGGMKTEVIYVP